MNQSTTTTPAQNDASRCSFYAILQHQTRLFRGGYVNGANSSVQSKLKSIVILYTESLLDATTTTNGVASGEGDTESVQSDLDVLKLVNNDKDQVRVKVKKRNQQRKLGKAGSVRSPPTVY